jgi:hypothetical protein
MIISTWPESEFKEAALRSARAALERELGAGAEQRVALAAA